MKWISYSEQRPDHSQPYLISVSRPYMGGTLTFNYVARYDAKTNKWYKHDAFSDDEIQEEITEDIVGWLDGLTTYLG